MYYNVLQMRQHLCIKSFWDFTLFEKRVSRRRQSVEYSTDTLFIRYS